MERFHTTMWCQLTRSLILLLRDAPQARAGIWPSSPTMLSMYDGNESTITHPAHAPTPTVYAHIHIELISNLQVKESSYAQKPSLSICLTTAQTAFSSEASFAGTPSPPEAPTCMIVSRLLILHGNLLFLFQCLLFFLFFFMMESFMIVSFRVGITI